MKLTHCYPWLTLQDRATRREIMRQFADCDSTAIVLTDKVIRAATDNLPYLLDFMADMKDFSLQFVDAHAPWGTWSDPGMPLETWHEPLILRQKIALDLCHICGVTTMAYHTGNTFNSIFGQNLVLEDYYRMLIRSLEELLPYAEKKGVIIALENQWTPLNHTSVMLKVMNHFQSPWLGLCCDTGHANVMEKGSQAPDKSCVPPIWNDLGEPVIWEENVIETMSPWLVNCHLHDNDGNQDQHLLPARGNIDWTRIRKALRNAPRLKCIQNEATFPKNEPLAPICTELKAFFAELLD